MSNSPETARREDDGAETILDNARGNNVATTTARMTVEAAHRRVMEGVLKDERENAAEEKNE